MLLRFFSFLFLSFLLSLPFSGMAQETGTQSQQVVALKFKTGTLEAFLKALEMETKIPFSYSNEALPLQKKITLSGREKTLDEILTTLFKGTNITWLYRPDQILLFEKNPAGSSAVNPSAGKNQRYTVSGYVREAGSAEPLIGVTIYAPELNAGITSNNFGFYSLTFPADSITLQFSYVGFKPATRRLLLSQDLNLNVNLVSNEQLKEVEIIAERQPRSTQTAQTSQMQIPVDQIKDIPALLGEKDVIKAVQLMPGVQKGNEGSTGLYVRGGGPDQNLIILDDATVYNSNHAFGLFSVFNGYALKNIEVTKGGFPARYGGRLSSVLDMTLKEGSKEKIQGEGGIGLIASRLLLEGPLIKEKASFLVSVRRTYLDALIAPFMNDTLKFRPYFYDSNLKLTYDFGRKDKVYVSGYFGRDNVTIGSQSPNRTENNQLFWGNVTGTVRWNHLVNDRLFSNTSFIYSKYRLVIDYDSRNAKEQSSFRFFSGIRDFSLKSDFDFYPTLEHYLKFGGVVTHHYFTPSAIRGTDSETDFNIDNRLSLPTLESALYAEDFFSPVPKLLLNTGVRLTHFISGNHHFFNPEPRLSAAYQFTRTSALKASFASMNQYIHLLSSTGTGLPIDLWLPANEKVKPQRAQQVALGIAQDLFKNTVTVEIEGYYKKLNQIITYNENANFLTIAEPAITETELNWEENVTSGQGWAYGLEFLVQKKVGKFTGWLGYTLSKTEHQFDSLNGGRKFYARYDRRHDVSITGSYKISSRLTFSASWVYGTGNAITLPTSEYWAPNHNSATNSLVANYLISDYGERSNFRVPAYHRLDVGVQFRKQLSWAERSWEVSVYNFYNRKNPYYYSIVVKNGKDRVLQMTSMFPLIPSVSYNLKF